MKLAHVISSCCAGGAEMFVKSLLENITKTDRINSIQLWVMSKIEDISPNDVQKLEFEKKFIYELESSGVEVKFIKKRPGRDWSKTKKELRKIYNSFKPDIIHTHLESVTFHTCRALYKYNVPIIQTIHSTVINYPVLQKYYINRRVHAYVAISEKVRNIIYRQIGISYDRIYLIYNGVQIDKFKTFNRNVGKSVNTIISIGRLTKQKDHENLLNAMKILIDKLNAKGIKVPDLFIVGEGELEKEIKELSTSLGINEHTRFLGIRQDIPDLLSKSDIYVMSSEWEGLSISLIEASASGIPIVATDAGSNSEIIENGVNGLVVPVKNPEALAEGLYQVIMSPDLRRKFTDNSGVKVKKFRIEDCALNHIDMYTKIAKQYMHN